MRTNKSNSFPGTAGLLASVLLLAGGAATAQVTVPLTAGPSTTTLPDGTSVPMWGYTCGTVTGTGASCVNLNPTATATQWSPVVITVPAGQNLQINLTNNLSFGGNNIPTSLTIIGQLGGGLGTAATFAPSPDHTNAQAATWPIAGTPPGAAPVGVGTPPVQLQRVQSFGMEVEAVAAGGTAPTCVASSPATGCGILTWSNLKAGTYLIESGTHPSIQGPMGLYGILVVTTAPNGGGVGTAYPGTSPVSYNAEAALLLSEIDPVQNTAVDTAVRTVGFSETATLGPVFSAPLLSISVDNGGSGYTSVPAVTLSGGGGSGAHATAIVDTNPTSPTFQQVTAVTLDLPGTGYTSPPQVMFGGPPGSGAAATANLALGPKNIANCGDATGVVAACYPPAVNYTPLYYLVNGAAFNKTLTGASNPSLVPVTQGTNTGAVDSAGTVLVRLVNAGLRMHVPSIVGAQTGAGGATASAGFALIAEDGNVLPGVRRVQSEVFMAAGKTYDVMINVPAACTPAPCTATALPIYDRELSLSANAIARDAGMLAYISVNGAALPAAVAAAAAGVLAKPDTYNSIISGHTLVISDPARGVLANDVNVTGAQLQGTVTGLTLNPDGTFVYTAGTPTSFTYCGNGATSGPACATVTLGAANLEAAGLIKVGSSTFSANGTFVKIQPPGILAAASDPAGYLLTVAGTAATGSETVALTAGAGTGSGSATIDANGGFTASITSCAPVAPGAPCSATFTFTAQNSQGSVSTGTGGTGTVTINFQPASARSVTVLDGADLLANKLKNPLCATAPATAGCATHITDYRWVLEEDRTFYIDPKCTDNPPAAGCASAASGIVPTFGTNFHTSYMPVIATGCTGTLSCEGGQSIFDPASGGHITAVCDQGNGVCRPDPAATGFTPHSPGEVNLDPSKRYYLSVLPGDAGNPFNTGNLTGNCQVGVGQAVNPETCGHGMGGAPIAAAVTCITPVNTTTTTCTAVKFSGTPPAPTCIATYPAVCTPAGTTIDPVVVLTEPDPYPPAQLSVFVFEDDFPLNGEHDAGGGVDVLAPLEPGLGGFNITLFDDAGGTGDATGQMTYDMFNQPLVNSLAGTKDPVTGIDACPISKTPRVGNQLDDQGNPIAGTYDATQLGITGTIVTCPKFEADGTTLSPLAGQAVIPNLMVGRYGVVATPGADRIAKGEEWLQTNTLDGQKAHDSFLRIGEPSYFQEFGPAGYHVAIGFANPAIINGRLAGICKTGGDGFLTGLNCTNVVTGFVSTERMSRTPDQRLYGSGSNDSFAFTQCYVSLGDTDGEDFAFTKCDDTGHFTLNGIPDGSWRITVFDQWNDMLVDGLSTPVRVDSTDANSGNVGEIAMNQWQANIYTSSFIDSNGNGVRDGNEAGLSLVSTNIRFRDGSYSNFNNTDLSGNAGFNEVFPLFSWYVVETDSTRYKSTGTHVVYDEGGPADNSKACTTTGQTAPCDSSHTPDSWPYAYMANTVEQVSVPAGTTTDTNLRVPGAVYCASADCAGHSISAGPGSSDPPSVCSTDPTTGLTTCGTKLSTGRIDPAWVASEGWQGFSGQNSFIDFGKRPFKPGENGGIHGEVIYASTRPFDDPQLLLHTSWTPDVPGVTINLYQVGTAPDGSQSLQLVDTTKTSSWDDWAQGFYPGTQKPYMNCPGQLAAPTTAASGDLFFYTLFNQPMFLDLYNNAHQGTASHTVPNSSQYKCYDGMHNWNQLQPAPYDGMYQFPSIIGRDALSGAPIGRGALNGVAVPTAVPNGTNCSICTANPVDGTPMLPSGQYVVEMIVPPGYELVKEEDKNILIGDNYIAPVTQEFPGLGGSIYILPDQASVAAVYNANQGALSGYNPTNAQNPSQAFGRQSALPSYEGDTGSIEAFWPCVGTTRIVPDYISLFPQSTEVAPFAGARRNLCDRKLVTVADQSSVLTKFWVFTSTHVAAHFTGVITDDFTSEFDPFSPQFGEKFSPSNLPVAIKDWTGQEIERVYSDQWGAYDGLTYSTWEVNPPNPTGYGPTMMVTCMNDAGSSNSPDPLFNPAYSQFCYEIPFMPGQTQYMDTPVVPTSAFAGAGYNNPDCAYPNATPAVAEVDGDGLGPWVGARCTSATGCTHTVNMWALGNVPVNNYGYSGPSASGGTFSQKTVTRRYSFGAAGTVRYVQSDGTLSGPISGVSWTDTKITFPVTTGNFPNGNTPLCAVQQQAQYGGPGSSTAANAARCVQLVLTTAGGQQSVDTVTLTIGGKPPTHVGSTASIQAAIDAASPGDMLIIDPLSPATATGFTPAIHQELLIMWKPVRLQGVGAASSIVDANTHPAGQTKMDTWRRMVNCLFGLALNGQPNTGGNPFDPVGTYKCPSGAVNGGVPVPGTGPDGNTWNYFSGGPNYPAMAVDRIPLEGILGWDATVNGNLAEQLQEPSLMGAYEGAGITVVSKGVNIPAGDGFGSGAEADFPAGTTLLSGTTGLPAGGGTPTLSVGDANGLCRNGSGGANRFPGNFQCNPSAIDALTVRNSSQGGGGIFVHGWGHNIQIANNRITNNSGTLGGGINIGQGEFPEAYIGPQNAANPPPVAPGSCLTSGTVNVQLPYCLNVKVNVHHNNVTLNSSIGDELFSGTPAGAGGVNLCTGADYYKFNYNWVCGNLSSGDGGGLAHLGFNYNGDIENNSVLFNQSTNPTITTNGGGIIAMGVNPDAPLPSTATGAECGAVTDIDCAPGLTEGAGPNLVINANLLMGNSADSGSGGGLRLQAINGVDVLTFPATPARWYTVQVTNNIVTNNVAGWDGAGISMIDALNANIINNTVVSNDSTASAGVLFDTLGAPLGSSTGVNCIQNGSTTASCRQPAGIVSVPNSAQLMGALGSGTPTLPPAPTITCPANHFAAAGGASNGTCRTTSYPALYNNLVWQNRTFNISVGAFGMGTLNQQHVVSLVPALTQTTTGSCPTTPDTPSYWDIGVRGDTGPANHGSGVTLNPQYSFLTSTTGYAANNSQGNPTVMSQYCNGSRVPPEAICKSPQGVTIPCGFQVPPGIADATVPNPFFNLTPAATVDEGNNWINMSWGPLTLVSPSTNVTLGNYALAAGSPAINFIPSTANGTFGAYTLAPPLDFFGNTRKNGFVDAGAVEFAAGGAGAILNVTGGPLNFGTSLATQNLTLHNTGTAAANTIAVAITDGFTRVTTGGFPVGVPNCGATLAAGANCTIKVGFAPTAAGAYNGTATITANVTVSGSPVVLSGTGTGTLTATFTPTTWAPTQTRNCPGTTLAQIVACMLDPAQAFTLRNTSTGNLTLSGITVGTLGGANGSNGTYAIVTLLSTCGPAGLAPNTALAPGASCVVTVQFKPLTSLPAGAKPATVSVTDALGTQTSTLNGQAN
jgi:hypothetical protein